jgi:hypothetical protein
MADYAAADTAGKLNIIGGGLTAIGYVRDTGTTAAFAVVMSVTVPARHFNEACSVELVLEDAAGAPVSLPGPAPGQAQVLRIGQAIQFGEPKAIAGVPRLQLPLRNQWVVAFSNGLPLPVGQRYVWRAKIDHDSRDAWTEEFFVPGPIPGLVLG